MLRRLLILLAVTVACLSQAAARADTSGPDLDRLLGLMDVEKVLGGFPEALMQGMDENPDAWTADLGRDRVRALAEKHFGARVLADAMRRLMAGRLSEAELAASIAFYESDLGRRIVAMEVASAEPGLSRTVEIEGARIYRELEAADSPRAEQIRRMVEAVSLVEWGMTMVMNMGYAMFTALYATPGTEGGMSEEQILAMLNSSMGGMRDELAGVINAETAYTYRDLSDADFARYVAYLETPEGQALARASLDAMRTAMIAHSRAFGGDLRELMRQRRS